MSRYDANSDINFKNAVDFAEYLTRHGQMFHDEIEIFEIPKEEVTRYSNENYHDTYQVKYKTYQAMVRVFDIIKTVSYTSAPDTLPGWTHGSEGKLILVTSNKKEAVMALKELGVSREKLTPFEKTKTSALREMLDASSIDNDDEEVTLKTKGEKNESFTISLTNPKLPTNEVTVAMKKNPRNTQIEYRLFLDWTKEWDAKQKELESVLSKGKFHIFQATIG